MAGGNIAGTTTIDYPESDTGVPELMNLRPISDISPYGNVNPYVIRDELMNLRPISDISPYGNVDPFLIREPYNLMNLQNLDMLR